jgi:hypothetical protein
VADSQEVGDLERQRPAVAVKASLWLTGERIEPVVAQVVGIAEVDNGARVGCPAEEELPEYLESSVS